jgi:hypothetical protein
VTEADEEASMTRRDLDGSDLEAGTKPRPRPRPPLAPKANAGRTAVAPPYGPLRPAAVVALQRSVGNAATGAVIQRHAAGEGEEAEIALPPAGPGGEVRTVRVQRVKDVFAAKGSDPFADPVAHLSKGGDNKVVEDPGSQGILGEPDKAAIKRYAKKATRTGAIADFGLKRAAWQAIADDAKLDATTRKDAENRAQFVDSLVTSLSKVTDRQSAALFFRQNTLTLAKAGLSPIKRHSSGTKGGESYTFHRDTGYLTVPQAAVSTPAVADVQNGPWNRGWVRGHDRILNMKHRFIEHIHVNKGQDSGIDIFNGNAADGVKADAWSSKGPKALQPGGADKAAVDAVIDAAGAADLATYI